VYHTCTNIYFQSFSRRRLWLRLWRRWWLSQRWFALLFTPLGDPRRIGCASLGFSEFFSSFFWMVVVIFTTVVYVFVPFFYPCLLWICYFESRIFSSKILYWSCCELEVQILPVQSSKLIKTKWCTTTSYPFKLVYCLAVGKYSARWSGERSTPDRFTICCETMSADLTNLFELWEG